ncbi:hypothetical protein JCM31826_11100 [Thermaurantimonas aggregans]|uniref:Bacterial surface antigen (D15) domain-containing protein n=2 Tax=Thermaurantimonas aggregans TaxID=2173829 RepID=A0A401XKU5_9FLAO|nr:hypothetical protein JCM31826_11100 [Thermaurantimonas aggregans]
MLFRILLADSCCFVSAQDSISYRVLDALSDSVFSSRGVFFSKIDSLFLLYNHPFYTFKEVKRDSCVVFYLNSGIGLTDSVIVTESGLFMPNEKISITQLKNKSREVVQKCTNNGYPFARVVPRVLYYNTNIPVIKVEVDSGPLIKIDSLIIKSEKSINITVIKRISGLRIPMAYSQKKIDEALERISASGFLEFSAPSSVLFTEEGSILYLYAKQKQSVFGDLIIGLNSDNQQRTVITGEAQLSLSNLFGSAEKISIQWRAPATFQQFLHLRGDFPFLFHTPIGLSFDFQVFRQDSTFARFSSRIGAAYYFSSTVSAGLGWMRERSSSVNLVEVGFMPFSSTYQLVHVQYNGKRGKGSSKKGLRNVLEVGIGTIRKSETLENRLRLLWEADADLPISKNHKIFGSFFLKSINGPGILLNESYRTGGFGSIRGFNEWSFFVTSAALGVLEYRIYLDYNSYIKMFYDAGWQSITGGSKGYYQGFGAGLALPVSVGMFHVDVAVGKFPNMPMDFRNTRLHIGFRSGLD